jgi:D-alanine transaminase
MTQGQWVYFDDAFCHAEAARLSPFDRGYLFAHAAYEVTAVYKGELIDFDGRIARLKRTLEGLEIPAKLDNLAALHTELIARNALREGLIYLQITAGDYASRDFYGPETFTPSLFMFSIEKQLINDSARDGITAITLEDTRWQRRDFKTTQLLSQSLAYRAARRAGATTAFMHEDGVITEAASANTWIVLRDKTLVTRALSASILPGITRQSVLDLLSAQGLHVEERSFTIDEAKAASEAFTSSAGAMIAPVLKLDDTVIGTGTPGPVTRTVQRAYYNYIGADVARVAPWALA